MLAAALAVLLLAVLTAEPNLSLSKAAMTGAGCCLTFSVNCCHNFLADLFVTSIDKTLFKSFKADAKRGGSIVARACALRNKALIARDSVIWGKSSAVVQSVSQSNRLFNLRWHKARLVCNTTCKSVSVVVSMVSMAFVYLTSASVHLPDFANVFPLSRSVDIMFWIRMVRNLIEVILF